MQEEEEQIFSKVSRKINLEAMSEEALKDYLTQLKQEITRVQDALFTKNSARSDAEALFGGKPKIQS